MQPPVSSARGRSQRIKKEDLLGTDVRAGDCVEAFCSEIAPGARLRNARSGPSGYGRCSRQMHSNRGALAQVAFGPQLTSVLLHHTVNHGQPEAHPLPHFLGGEERLEQPAERSLIHAPAGVGNREQDVLAGHHGFPACSAASASVSLTCSVETVSRPPPSMASRAFLIS